MSHNLQALCSGYLFLNAIPALERNAFVPPSLPLPLSFSSHSVDNNLRTIGFIWGTDMAAAVERLSAR